MRVKTIEPKSAPQDWLFLDHLRFLQVIKEQYVERGLLEI